MLTIATVGQSLVLQSPESWRVARALGLDITFAAAADKWIAELSRDAEFVETAGKRSASPAAIWQLAISLRRLAGTGQWDLVQVQTPLAACVWRIVAPAGLRCRTIYVVHGFQFHHDGTAIANLVFRLVERVLIRRCLALALVSAEDLISARKLRGASRRPMLVGLPGAGVDVEDFAAARPVVHDQQYALFCGELNRNKDPMLAIEAVEEARRRGCNLGMVVIGDGPLAAGVASYANTCPWVKVIPKSRAVAEWMAGASVLLAPSRREGLPRVVVEALAADVLVLARSNRGSRELLADGVGVIMPAKASVADWASAIQEAMSADTGRGLRLARAREYGLDVFRPAYEALLQRCLSMCRV
jgi:glycosyltransferase involved in cell wall biosynthesis